jgi:hypothetical protein
LHSVLYEEGPVVKGGTRGFAGRCVGLISLLPPG